MADAWLFGSLYSGTVNHISWDSLSIHRSAVTTPSHCSRPVYHRNHQGATV